MFYKSTYSIYHLLYGVKKNFKESITSTELRMKIPAHSNDNFLRREEVCLD